MYTTKFTKVKGKITFEAHYKDQDKTTTLHDVQSLDEVLRHLLLEFKANVFSLVDMLKNGLALAALRSNNDKMVEIIGELKLSGKTLKIVEGDTLDDVLARGGAGTPELIRTFYHKYFKVEFNKAFDENLGV